MSAFASGCVQASQIYALETAPERGSGSVQVERIEGQQRLLVVQLDELPAPESLGAGLHVFTVWLSDLQGRTVKAGQLRYDHARRSGNLIATTDLSTFTVRITGERDADANAPGQVLLAVRKVTHN